MTRATIKERPILFSGPMVRAILAGAKTQTRRVVKPQPRSDWLGYMMISPGVATLCGPDYPDGDNDDVRCPYGEPGNLLWIRETWAVHKRYDELPGRDLKKSLQVVYKTGEINELGAARGRWRCARFLPRRYCRLVAEVTEVRVQRVQDISNSDATAEGFLYPGRQMFHITWNRINARRGYPFEANIWVWAVSFKLKKQMTGIM